MVAFALNWTVFQLCGICPVPSSASASFKTVAILFAVFNVTAEVLSLSSSLTFGIESFAIDLEGAVHALCHQAAAATTVLYMMFVAYLKRAQIVRLFERTQQLCDKHGPLADSPIFDDAKQANQTITSFMVKHVIAGYFIFSFMLGISNGIYCYIDDGRQINSEHLLIPYKFA